MRALLGVLLLRLLLRAMQDAEHDDMLRLKPIEDTIPIVGFDKDADGRLVGALAETREVAKHGRELRERAQRVPNLHIPMRL